MSCLATRKQTLSIFFLLLSLTFVQLYGEENRDAYSEKEPPTTTSSSVSLEEKERTEENALTVETGGVNFIMIRPQNRSYYYKNYRKTANSQTCVYNLPENFSYANDMIDENGYAPASLFYECDLVTEYCCQQMNCCKQERIPSWCIILFIICIIVVICGSQLALDWREEDSLEPERAMLLKRKPCVDLC